MVARELLQNSDTKLMLPWLDCLPSSFLSLPLLLGARHTAWSAFEKAKQMGAENTSAKIRAFLKCILLKLSIYYFSAL